MSDDTGTPEAAATPVAVTPHAHHHPYAFAIGQIRARFRDPGVEKEFTQVMGATDTKGLTTDEVLREVLARPENRYLARQMQYVLTIQGVDTYDVVPRYSDDYDKLISAVRPAPTPLDLDVVVGVRGPLATADSCNGFALPVLEFHQLYSFDRPTLFKAIQKPSGMSAARFRATADEVLTKILQITENAGATPEDRAANFVACRYEAVYLKTFEAFAGDYALTSIDVRPAAVGGDQDVMSFTVSYTSRTTDLTEKNSVLVATRYMNPYLLTRLGPSL
ncbi:cyanobactin maturation protease PatG family protein [Streptomyces huasconensis]|uniref:cyanobactin maturation protease PatG family protein n=1 Tax=Streptomyces huasconensis TaxID=1854574 RepID=UPI0036F78406